MESSSTGAVYVTGFGPFGDIQDNPSAELASLCGRRHAVLEVSFQAVLEWLDALDPNEFGTLLLMGLNAGADTMRLEMLAHNTIGPKPDVRNEIRGPGLIRPGAPAALGSTLWPALDLLPPKRPLGRTTLTYSFSAGSYLCNYISYEALTRFPDKRVGFLHVPPVNSVSLERQRTCLAELLELAERVTREPSIEPAPEPQM